MRERDALATAQYSARMRKLREEAAESGLKGVFLVPGPNLRYYTGGNSLLLERPFFMAVPVEGIPHLVSPQLEAGPYHRSPVNITIHSWSDSEGPSKAIQETVEALNMNGKWGVEGDMPYRYADLLLKFARPELENVDQILQSIRALKDSRELKLLTRAAAILSKSFLAIPNKLEAGITELDLARSIGNEIQSKGGETVPEVLVQSGPMAADGHHLPSSRKIKRRESVVVDATCTHQGYFADITRTFILGKNKDFENLYDEVLQAQVSAMKTAKAGATVGAIDEAARSSFREKNLDGLFIHRTGHGLGLEVHEAPYIVPNGTEPLQPSMAFTIEPGVYMPGKTGLRIEDDLISTSNRSKVLTKSVPSEFGWWN